MASLTEVYRGGGGAGLRRLYAGVVLFGVGAVLVTAGLAVASTELGASLGLDRFGARELAGVLGGLGLPAVLVGTMVALPRASRRLRVTAAVGAIVCLAGVGLFARSYPVDWVGGSGDTTMTLAVSATYFVGAIVTSWSLFSAVANFKARNDPGGTVSLEVTKEGETRVVEVSNDDLRRKLGGIGTLGATPDGDAETQTNRSVANGGAAASRTGDGAAVQGAAANSTDGGVDDGGAIREPDFSDDAELIDDGDGSVAPISDRYCGNCAYFRYVRTDEGLVPYCGLHSETMDDMDACEEWSPNTN